MEQVNSMAMSVSFLVSLAVAYYWTGFEMVTYHLHSRIPHRPSYVNGSRIRRFAGGLIWPFVCKANRELGWFFSCFVSYTLLLTIILTIATKFIPVYVCIIIIGIIRLIPAVQNILTIPAASIAGIFLAIVARPLGSKMPDGMNPAAEKPMEQNKTAPRIIDAPILEGVDYQTKIDNLLAVKGVRDEYVLLQGWDPDFGKRSAHLCTLAKKAGEDPIIIAAFLLESIKSYHKNRDVSLSYLARMESAYTARIENPELAREIDVETSKQEEFAELFASIDLDARSPEANYIREVNNYIVSVGYFNTLVEPASKNEGFSNALSNVYLTGYSCNSSPQVVGALIADGANKFKFNTQIGILFLNNVAKNMRKQNDESLQGDKEIILEETSTNRSNKKVLLAATDPTEYHNFLDKMSEDAFRFFLSIKHVNRGDAFEVKLKLMAELVIYLTTFKAWIDSKTHIYPGTWNTFKRSVEFRMLTLEDDGQATSGLVSDNKSNQIFAHFVNSYWSQMDGLETRLRDNTLTDFATELLSEFQIDLSNTDRFVEFFEVSQKVAGDTILKAVIAMES